MTLENKDMLQELITSLKQAKAVYHSFENDFVQQQKKIALLAVESRFEDYQYLASVLSDLIHKASEQAEKLDAETDNETIRAV